jgi:thiosulfate/3-mercaptopyruvate sulfurtransferase
MNWTTLVSCEDLQAALGTPGLAIVDARFVLSTAPTDVDAGERTWRQARLPGAGYVHLNRELSDLRKPASEGRHPLPEASDFCDTLSRLGISPDSQVVVYDNSDAGMAAARFWWLLKLLGHERVAVLNGGFVRWQKLAYPIESRAPAAVASAVYPKREFDATQIVRTEQVEARLHEAPGWILDARSPERFRGEVEPIDPVAGHIPGALNRPYSANLRDGTFRSPEELREEFSALIGSRRPDEIFLNCGSGVTACPNLLAMEYAGLHGARIYAGSWSGWISDRRRPVATGG